jgi:hypothetical protein
MLTFLEPLIRTLLDRHLAAVVEWFPHELVPYKVPRRRALVRGRLAVRSCRPDGAAAHKLPRSWGSSVSSVFAGLSRLPA